MMYWPKMLVLVRHAESEGNVHDLETRISAGMIATHEFKLTNRGQRQAEITGQYLKKYFGFFDAYLVSTYMRSRATMKIMYPDAKVCEDSRLAEGQRGIWHIMTHEEVLAQFPKEPE